MHSEVPLGKLRYLLVFFVLLTICTEGEIVALYSDDGGVFNCLSTSLESSLIAHQRFILSREP